MRIKPITLILCGFFAALTAAFSQIAIPIPGIPINLATLSVLCSGLLLGSKLGAVSQLVFVLTGLAGAPVFSMMKGGAAVIAGPTGGYIIGYVIAAFTVGLITEKFGFKAHIMVIALIIGYISYTLPGTVWYIIIMETNITAAFFACVAPYIPGDVIKMALAWALTPRLKAVLRKYQPI